MDEVRPRRRRRRREGEEGGKEGGLMSLEDRLERVVCSRAFVVDPTLTGFE